MGCEHYTVDAKAEFAADYCWPAVKANGDYQGYPLSTAIARPLIGLKAVEIARQTGVDAFCHGCTGKGNDQFRIEYVHPRPHARRAHHRPHARAQLHPHRRDRLRPRAQHPDHRVSADKIWTIDENIWGRSIEGGHLEEPDYAPPEEIFQWTANPLTAPDALQKAHHRLRERRHPSR